MFSLMSTKVLREAAEVATFVVSMPSSRRAEFFIEMALNDDITKKVRALFVAQVTPLLVIVSTSHGGTVHFDPEMLRFEQGTRTWQPQRMSDGLDIVPADYRQRFGGTLSNIDVQLGFILVPEGFDFKEPVAVHYGAVFLGVIPHDRNGAPHEVLDNTCLSESG